MKESPDQPSARALVRAILDLSAGPWYAAGTETQREKILNLAEIRFKEELDRILSHYWSV